MLDKQVISYVAMVNPKLAVRVRTRRTIVIMAMNLYSIDIEEWMSVLET